MVAIVTAPPSAIPSSTGARVMALLPSLVVRAVSPEAGEDRSASSRVALGVDFSIGSGGSETSSATREDVDVGVAAGWGVWVGLAVGVGAGMEVGVAVGMGVAVGVGVGVGVNGGLGSNRDISLPVVS